MALLKQTKGREDGGYTRLFGDPQMGRLLSRVQSAVIRAGAELEQAVIELAKTMHDVDAFLDADILHDGAFVASKKALKRSKRLNYAGVEPDFVVFERSGKAQHCYLIELKGGDTFDTKKAAGERDSLYRFMNAIAPNIQFTISIHFCCFHRNNREDIVNGFKRKIRIEDAMTGQEFCDLIGIDYQAVLLKRKEHQEENLNLFVDQLMRIPAVQNVVDRMLAPGKIDWEGCGGPLLLSS